MGAPGGRRRSALATTPGPEMPTEIAASPSPKPWKAPAMKGLSGTALAKTTSLAQPIADWSAVTAAVSFTTSPMNATASMLMPAPVVATFTEPHTRVVCASAYGSAAMTSSSIREACFSTIALKPPMKSTPTVAAASSSARARSSSSS